MIYALVILEGLVLCFLLLLVCVVGIANGPAGLVILYEKDVQERVVELGLTSKKKLKNTFLLRVESVIRTRLKLRNFGAFRLILIARHKALLLRLHQKLLEIPSVSGR